MPDHPGIRGAQDRWRINMRLEHEVRYWTEKLNVTREALRNAVDHAGPMFEAVERELHRRGRGMRM